MSNYYDKQTFNNNQQDQFEYGSANAPPAPPAYNDISQGYSGGMPSNIQYAQPSREDRFRDILNRHEISQYFSAKLQLLSSFKIVFVFDDSGSMNTSLNDSPLNSGLLKATRWDELQYFSKISIEIANIFNQNGSDVYFLNRPMIRNVNNPDALTPCFNQKPGGYTPLARVLRTLLANNNQAELNERKLLIIIVTDGEPTDDSGRVDIQSFKEVLRNRHNNVYTTIVSCTDEDNTMDYLNNWDRTMPRLDVVDDFRSEKIEIIRSQGRNFRFSFGDYVVKSLLGSIDHSLDKLDENRSSNKNSSCSIL